MTKLDGIMFFGYFQGLPYKLSRDAATAEKFDDYKKYKNSIPKEDIIRHIETEAEKGLSPMRSEDIFTGESVTAGMFIDGNFRFPTDFLHYLKNYDIGIPYEYENYLKEKIGA